MSRWASKALCCLVALSGIALSSSARAAPLSQEDREVVENLELLESLEEADALELLLELSKEDEGARPSEPSGDPRQNSRDR
jgi:hypothetical protein